MTLLFLFFHSIGGGTGWEIEEMSKIMDIKSFDSIYL